MRNIDSLILCLSITFFAAQDAFGRETVGGQNRPRSGPSSTATEGVPVGQLDSRLKNKKLADELTKLLEDCLPRVAQSANRQLTSQDVSSCKVHLMGDCRTAEAAMANARSGTGAANSCHRNDNGCKAADIGKIECGDFKLVPASESDGNEYYLRLAKCMSGDTFEGDTQTSSNGKNGKQHSGGVCYHDPCKSAENTVGNCPNHSHTNHIHFSGDGCGNGEHAHAHSDPPTGPAASCGKAQAQNNMRRAT